jgi:hypothetical protein
VCNVVTELIVGVSLPLSARHMETWYDGREARNWDKIGLENSGDVGGEGRGERQLIRG